MTDVPPDITSKARKEDATALGKLHFNAALLKKNCDTAFNWILWSAEQGNMEAQFRLGDLYALGHGTSKSLQDAYQWYTKAAIQGYKKSLIRIHNLYQEDVKMHCRGQMSSAEEKWTSDEFKMSNNIRELYEYRVEKNKGILNHAIDYYTEQFKQYQSSNQEDAAVLMNMAFLYQHGYGVKKCIRWAFEYYKMAAKKGNIDAQYNLGDLYQKHKYIKFNYRHAFKWYTESAKGGNVAAQKSLAYFYLKGLATDIDDDVAVFWYTKAAEAGDSQAQVVLGKLYRKGETIEQNLDMAVKWYSLAARQGNIVAQNCLSQLYQRGMLDNIILDEDMSEYFTEGSINKRLCTKLMMDMSKLDNVSKSKKLNELVKHALIGDGHAMYEIGLKYYHGGNEFIQDHDKDTGIKWIKNAAHAKYKDAQLLIADIYKKGDPVEQDYHKSAIWYKLLAKQKDANGQYNVGIMYSEGLGIREDPLEASRWFTWAANQGNTYGQCNLGLLIHLGRGLRRDKKKSINLFYQAASLRNPLACFQLGYIYFYGLFSVKEDKKSAITLWEFAAQNGNTRAQLELANKNKEGIEIQQNIQNYIKYITMAANSGSAKAQYSLAIEYLKGDDIRLDHVKAYHLFKQSSNNGYIFAKWIFQIPMLYEYDIGNVSNVIDMFNEVMEREIDDLRYNLGFLYEHGLKRPVHVFKIDYVKAKKWYMAASDRGDSRADYRLGIMHELGRGVEKSLKTAMKYYKKASIKENSNAICRLAYIYLSGHSVTRYRMFCMHLNGYHVAQDLLKAFQLYTNASAMGNEEATRALTVLESYRKNNKNLEVSFEKDLQILFDKENQIMMLEKATEEGYTKLQYQVGVMYENDNDDSNAFKWFSLAAKVGVTDAYYRLGIFYEEGNSVEQDYTMAAKMYRKATEKDHEDACYRLGQLYQYGNGVKLDYLKAYQYYKKAEDMGHLEAYKALNITLESKIQSNRDMEEAFFDSLSPQYQDSLSMCRLVAEYGNTNVQFKVGFAYEHSFSKPNYIEAYKWYSMAAENAHREAIYRLGLLYEKGLGVSQDYLKANQLYQQASQLDSDDALYRLGVAYHYGKGVEIDSVKAMEYYTISAKLGNPKYQSEIGRLYEEGELVQKNLLEALKWYTKAYLQGYDSIQPKLTTMDLGKPYEDVFYKKLFRNLSVACCGYFRLGIDYEYSVYSGVNYRLGSLYACGQGTDKDLDMAWEYFSRKYDHFHGALIENFLFLKYNGIGSSQKNDILRAFEDDEVFIYQMNSEQLYTLGMIFFDGIVHTQNIDKDNVKKGYTPIDDQSQDDPSQYIVIEKDYHRAFRCLKKAVDKDHFEAMLQLGIMYHCGYGVDKDSEQGEMYFDEATAQNVEFTGRIAILYHTHQGLQNFTKAFEWYKRLEQRLEKELDDISRAIINQQVQWGLGLLYEYGDGVKQNYLKALECYTRLADDDINIGMHRLALMYYYGKGVSVDYKKSFKLFKEATLASVWRGEKLVFIYDQNSFYGNDSQNTLVYSTRGYNVIVEESFYYLGLMYKQGRGTPQDRSLAQFYFKEALTQGCKRAECEIED